MLKQLLTSISACGLLLAVSFPVQAANPQLEPQQLMQSNHPLGNYVATDAVPILKRGQAGQPIADVQQFLKQTGLYTGAIDGIFGPASEAAVMQFQQQASLTADGIVGFETWKAIIRSLSNPVEVE